MSCTAADLINIQPLTLSDTFSTWFDRTNEVIQAANNLNIYDIGLGATSGLFIESGCSGGYYNGYALISVNVGAGLGIGSGSFTNNAKKVVVDALLLEDLGTGASANPATDDYIIVSDKSDTRQGVYGTPKRTTANRMLPPVVTFGPSGNGSFTIQGDVNIIGNLNVASTVSYIDSNDLRIEDKVIELALNRYSEFVVSGSGFTAQSFVGGQTAYYIDSGIPSSGNATTIGTVRNWSSGSSTTGSIQIHSFTVGGVSDLVLGGKLLVTGAAVTSVLTVTSSPAEYTDYYSDELLTPAGVEIKGASGDKTFLWNYRTPDTLSTWNAFMANTNLGVTGAANSIISSRFSSVGYNSATNNTFTFQGEGSSYSKFAVGSQLSMEHSPAGAAGVTFGIVAIGSTGTTYPNSTVYAWVKRFNADQLDGAHASTAATAWTIPVSLTDGRVHEDFIRADGVRKVFSVANSGFAKGDVVRIKDDGSLTFAKADTIPTAEVFGMVETVHGGRISVVTEGYITGLTGARINAVTPLVTGSVYYLSAAVGGGLIADPDEGAYALTIGQVRRAILLATDGDKGYVTAYAGTVVGGGQVTDLVYLSSVAPVGSITPYTGLHTTIPQGWLLCAGAIIGVNDYPDLALVLANSYYASGQVDSANSFVIDEDTRGIAVGDLLTISIYGATYDVVVSSVDSSTRIVTITTNDLNSYLPTEALTVTGRTGTGGRSTCFLPDLRRRTVFGVSFGSGLSGSGQVTPTIGLGNIGGEILVPQHTHDLTTEVATGSGAYGSSSPNTGNITTQGDNYPPYVATHWIIRASKTLPAVIITGHNHDSNYIRYDIPHTVGAGAANTLSASDRAQFRSNTKVLRNDGNDTFGGDLSITGRALIDGNTRVAGNFAVTGQSWFYTKATVVGAADVTGGTLTNYPTGTMFQWNSFTPSSNKTYNGYDLGKVQVMSNEPFITLFDINNAGGTDQKKISQGRVDFYGNYTEDFGWNTSSGSPTGAYYTGALVMTLAQQGATAYDASDNLNTATISGLRKEVRIGFNLVGVTSADSGGRSDETVFEISRHIINTNYTAAGNFRPRVRFPRGFHGATAGESYHYVVVNKNTGELKNSPALPTNELFNRMAIQIWNFGANPLEGEEDGTVVFPLSGTPILRLTSTTQFTVVATQGIWSGYLACRNTPSGDTFTTFQPIQGVNLNDVITLNSGNAQNSSIMAHLYRID